MCRFAKESIPIDVLDKLRSMDKRSFLEECLQHRGEVRALGLIE
jgi:hypothetical protein